MDSLIGVTGATGRVGGGVARLLAEAGVRQRLLVRSPQRAPQLPGAEVRQLQYDTSEVTVAALAGVTTLLMVSAAESAERLEQHQALITAASRAGVETIVYTSFIGAAADSTFALARDHGATEDMVRASGLQWTFLRDNFYQEAFVDFAVDGVIAGPAGAGRCAAVAIEDVARVAAAVLQTPSEHRGATHDLTGPEALTLDAIVALMTAAGLPTSYHDQSIEEAYASRAHYGAPQWQLDAWVSTYTAIADGDMQRVSSAVGQITGRPAQPFATTLARLAH